MKLNKFEQMMMKELQSIKLEDIWNIEKKYNFKFPKMMQEFYIKYNGRQLDGKGFYLDNINYGVDAFYSINSPTCNLEKCLFLLDFGTEEYIYPKFLVPFGCDQCGNDYLFSVRKDDEGSIYYINHETYESEDDIVYICENIWKFIDLLE